ncbi:protein of unknown function [Xenorhabdus bovienii]|uniref:Uncharacterized protein n=1 Tax=Xenorhabdus bovienii TaxID=40576 RepID=A0A0B6XEF3_XENBV|nr:protein of unknown function [Xenorhabdus bovienii]
MIDGNELLGAVSLLAMAIDGNELLVWDNNYFVRPQLDAVFMCYRISPMGQLEFFYEVKLTSATIVDFSCHYPHSIDDNDQIPYETVFLDREHEKGLIDWSEICLDGSNIRASEDAAGVKKTSRYR